jgi:hypothetical protein
MKIKIGGQTVTFEQLIAWGRYLYWADLMRLHAEATHRSEDEDEDGVERWFPLISYWYASLHIVVEGWEELGFTDPIIDKLLAHKAGYKQLLRRYRNGVFHYQPTIIEERFVDFLKHHDDCVFWPLALHWEFVRFFYDWLISFPGTEEQVIEFRQHVRKIIGGMPQNVVDQLEQTLKEAERIAAQSAAGSSSHDLAMEIGESAKEGRELLAQSNEGLSKLRMDILEKLLKS